MALTSFKAYDVRGKVPSALDENLTRRIGFAYAAEIRPERVVIGHDARLSSPSLYAALADGLTAAGVDVTGIGLCGTEEMYHAVFAHGFDGGIMVTGSHNPADENGLKMVRGNAVPISGDSGLFAIRDRVAADPPPAGRTFRTLHGINLPRVLYSSYFIPGSAGPSQALSDRGRRGQRMRRPSAARSGVSSSL